jgi:hypothetical protein
MNEVHEGDRVSAINGAVRGTVSAIIRGMGGVSIVVKLDEGCLEMAREVYEDERMTAMSFSPGQVRRIA